MPGVGRGDGDRLDRAGVVAACRVVLGLRAGRGGGLGDVVGRRHRGSLGRRGLGGLVLLGLARRRVGGCLLGGRPLGLFGGPLRRLGGLLLGEPALLLAPLGLERQADLLVGEALLLDLLEVLDLLVGLGGELLVAHPLLGDLVLLGGQIVGLALEIALGDVELVEGVVGRARGDAAELGRPQLVERLLVPGEDRDAGVARRHEPLGGGMVDGGAQVVDLGLQHGPLLLELGRLVLQPVQVGLGLRPLLGRLVGAILGGGDLLGGLAGGALVGLGVGGAGEHRGRQRDDQAGDEQAVLRAPRGPVGVGVAHGWSALEPQPPRAWAGTLVPRKHLLQRDRHLCCGLWSIEPRYGRPV